MMMTTMASRGATRKHSRQPTLTAKLFKKR